MAYCISQALAGISTDCQPNMGGIATVYITKFDDGIFTINEISGTSQGVVTGLKESGETWDGKWYKYNFRAESSNFTSTLNKTADGGNYVSTEIVLNFARMETQKRLEMNALALNEIAVVVKDNNNAYWAFGLDRPVASSTGSAESGQAFGDANRYSITLLSNDGRFAPELSPEAITALLGDVQND